jgi:hypothetical protein
MYSFSSDYKTLAQDGGYWQEQIPKSEAALCAVIDPAADFRWHSLDCGGPETASFICELPGMYCFCCWLLFVWMLVEARQLLRLRALLDQE